MKDDVTEGVDCVDPRTEMEINEILGKFQFGHVTAVRLVDRDEGEDAPRPLDIHISCKCNAPEAGSDTTLLFELRCFNVLETALTVGYVEEVTMHEQHPLLLKYHSALEYLHFTSAPSSPVEAVGALYPAYSSIMRGWRPLTDVLNPTVGQDGSRFTWLLSQGRGMLALGPKEVIHAMAQAVEGRMTINRVPAGGGDGPRYQVLQFDSAYVICESVEVVALQSP